VFTQRVEHHLRLEPVGKNQWHRREQAEGDVPDQARDVEQRRHPEDRTTLCPQPHPVAVDLRGELHVTVCVHGALGHPRGTGGVGKERDVVQPEVHRGRYLAAVLGDDLAEIGRALAPLAGNAREQPLVTARLEIQFAGGKHQPHIAVAYDLMRTFVIQ